MPGTLSSPFDDHLCRSKSAKVPIPSTNVADLNSHRSVGIGNVKDLTIKMHR
ncbi:unnamed protein product [Musa acuminata subsp. malaccensis]|uniref:(wild Malaysian banana) hypothetical protein n=1 Tax=Musa acuminata subsp. malaccensis TaxID=214687 RepID=A0A804KWL7_MUSAM|nr:unnamed protein product [Musa acuminata subsp. malaccensis]